MTRLFSWLFKAAGFSHFASQEFRFWIALSGKYQWTFERNCVQCVLYSRVSCFWLFYFFITCLQLGLTSSVSKRRLQFVLFSAKKAKSFNFQKNNGSLKIKNKYFFIMPSPTRGLFLIRKKVFRPTLFIFFIFFKLLIADFFLFLWEFFFNCKKKIRKFKNSLRRRQDKKVAKKYYRLHDILIKHNTCEKVWIKNSTHPILRNCVLKQGWRRQDPCFWGNWKLTFYIFSICDIIYIT